MVIPCALFAQYSHKEIYSLMTTENYRLRDENNFQKIINLSEKVIIASQKSNYKKGEIYGYTRLGNAHCNIGNFKESLQALNQATQLIEKYKFEDHYIQASIYLGIGRCYSETQVSYQNAIAQYEKAVFHAQKIPDQSDKKMQLSIIYTNMYSAYYNLQNLEKGVQYLRKVLSFDKEHSYTLIEMAKYHNENKKNADSAKIYLERAQKTKIRNYTIPTFYNQWGKYYTNKNEYDNAIEFYKKAEVLAKETGNSFALGFAFSELYHIYQRKGDLDKALIYSQKKVALNDSLDLIQAQVVEVAIKDIIQKKEKTTQKQNSKIQKIFIALGVLGVFIISFFIIKNYKNQKEKKKAFNLIEEKEEENHALQQKVNESFDEIVELAKSNNPEFVTRFQEVYPTLFNNLLKIDSKLRISELTLCAYIYLGFNSKDIANYMFKSLYTIKSRKHNLRKKLNIPLEDNIDMWMKRLE